jgi:hypothetical protein
MTQRVYSKNPKRCVAVTLDEEAVKQLRGISKAMGDVGVSAAVRWLAAEYCRRQKEQDAA